MGRTPSSRKLGVRFYLDGDVVPEERVGLRTCRRSTSVGRPLFKLRGIQPFHDFAEGPDWWNEDTYKAVLGQPPKLRMNFFGLHTYPEKSPERRADGLDRPARRVRTRTAGSRRAIRRAIRTRCGPIPDRTTGAISRKRRAISISAPRELFERDDYGPSVMDGLMPEPKTPEASNDLFNRTAAMLRGAFAFARRLGIQTCVGTETPLTIPALVQERLKAAGRDPKDPRVVKELYKGIFQQDRGGLSARLLLVLDGRRLDLVGRERGAIKAVTTDLAMAVAGGGGS